MAQLSAPWALTVQTAPASEPLTTAQAKTHLRVSHSNDDTYIDLVVKAARIHAEEVELRRALITQTLDLWLDAWPHGNIIHLPRPPLQSVTSIVYYDTDDTEATFASTNYHVDTNSEPGRIILNDGQSWASSDLRPAHAIRVRYVAGYGSAATSIPQAILHGLYFLVGHFYENREPVVVGTITAQIPLAAEALFAGHRIETPEVAP